MAKRCLPGITKWDTYAGGTFCPDNVHNYGITAPKGNYKVSCITSERGRMQGYRARFENVKGLAKRSGLHQAIHKDGATSDFGELFRSPSAAAAAANKHCELMDQGLAGSQRKRRRR